MSSFSSWMHISSTYTHASNSFWYHLLNFLSSTYLHVLIHSFSLCLYLPEGTHTKKNEGRRWKRHTGKKISSNVISHFVPLFFYAACSAFVFLFVLKITNGIFHFVHIFLHNIFLSRISPACLPACLVSFVFVFSLFPVFK